MHVLCLITPNTKKDHINSVYKYLTSYRHTYLPGGDKVGVTGDDKVDAGVTVIAIEVIKSFVLLWLQYSVTCQTATSSYVGVHYCPNFGLIALSDQKLLIIKVSKLDVCEDSFLQIRPQTLVHKQARIEHLNI